MVFAHDINPGDSGVASGVLKKSDIKKAGLKKACLLLSVALMAAWGMMTPMAPARAAGMAVFDAKADAQLTKSLSKANQQIAELKKHTNVFDQISRSIGKGGVGFLSDILGLSESGLGDLLDAAKGMCFNVKDLQNTRLELPGDLGLPDFRDGCASFSWAKDVFFTNPIDLSPAEDLSLFQGKEIMRERRESFRDANIQQAIASGMSHRERVSETGDTIVQLRAKVEEVQAGEDTASLRHAITMNSLILLHILEEFAAQRELLSDLLLLSAGNEMAVIKLSSHSARQGDGPGGPQGNSGGSPNNGVNAGSGLKFDLPFND